MAVTYELTRTVAIPPKNPESFDFGWVEPESQKYYLTDRTNAAIDVLDASTGDFIKIIRGFSTPNGILAVRSRNQLWVGDGGDNTVKVANMNDEAIVASVSTGTHRPDLVGYDPKHGIILVGCMMRDNQPFAAFISAKDFTMLGRIPYPLGTRVLETVEWNPKNERFYLAIPTTPSNPGGQIDIIDPVSMTVEKVIALKGCSPNGIALGPDQNLLACSGVGVIRTGGRANTQILDALTGEVRETISEVGCSDQVWFNPTDKRYYIAAHGMTSDGTSAGTPTPTLGVIDASTNKWLANVPTLTGSHSVAVNPKNNKVFVPLRTAGIGIYAERTEPPAVPR